MNSQYSNHGPRGHKISGPTGLIGLLCVLTLATTSAFAAPMFFGPTPYLSSADVPAGFYAGPQILEDFEDGSLDFGITGSPGSIFGPNATASPNVDSVEGGANGHAWFANGMTTFTFSGPLPTAAALVWTDGNPNDPETTFEAFGPGMASLGTIGPVQLADAFINGTTAEDRFFGVQDLGGILAIKITNSGSGIEVDHVQFGVAPVPSPSAMLLMGTGLLGLIGWRKWKSRSE